jgi:uncharacterized pyridoxamine 5'-phosphate oxidase family protein
MEFIDHMKQILSEQKDIALATSVDNKANVRILEFCTDDEKDGVLYFATFMGTQKTKEFAANDTAAFTTIPYGGPKHVRVHEAKVVKSAKTVYDLLEKFAAKKPMYRELVDQAGAAMELYEVHFSAALVIIDHEVQETVKL